MRFARLRKNSANDLPVKETASNRLILVTYNLVWWIPIVLPFTGLIDYGAGFIAFTIITVLRAGANLYRNNILEPVQAQRFPFRAP